MKDKQYFEYGEMEIAWLKEKDPDLGKAMDEIGYLTRELIPDLFMALINSIIGQQISTKAQETIWMRFLDMFNPITPEHIAAVAAETIQTCGISLKKVEYIKGIAQSVIGGSLNLDEIQAMSDEDVCKRLSQIKGIGIWTAEMLMIFSMQRKDVVSFGDMAILRGMRMLYRHRKITPALFAKYKRRYSPYGTVASLYLWSISHGGCEGLVDLAPKAGTQKKAKIKACGK